MCCHLIYVVSSYICCVILYMLCHLIYVAQSYIIYINIFNILIYLRPAIFLLLEVKVRKIIKFFDDLVLGRKITSKT